MKWFLSVCALAGVIAAVSSSCGPEKQFCPNHPPDFSCYANGGSGMGGGGGQDQGPCDGAAVIICGDPAQTKVCKQSDCPK